MRRGRPLTAGAVQVWDGVAWRWALPTAPGQVLQTDERRLPFWGSPAAAAASPSYAVDARPLVTPPALGSTFGVVTSTSSVSQPYTARRLDWTYAGSTRAGMCALGSLPSGAWQVTAAMRALGPQHGFSTYGIAVLSGSDFKICGVSTNPTYYNHVQAIQGYNTAGTATTSSAAPTQVQHTDLWTRRTWLQLDYDPTGIGSLTLRVSADGHNWDPHEVTWTGSVATPTAIGVGGGVVSSTATRYHAALLESWET